VVGQTVIISIKPQWVNLIAAGDKRIELRRRPPTLAKPALCAIYSTSPTAQLVLRCFIGPTFLASPNVLWREFGEASAVTRKQFDSYFAGSTHGGALPLSEVTLLNQPVTRRELWELFDLRPPQAWQYAPRRFAEWLEGAK
jgi:predicted transcriptional regulator